MYENITVSIIFNVQYFCQLHVSTQILRGYVFYDF